jgi:hypothetical protein
LQPPVSTVEKGHGRIERRTLRVSTALAGYSDFPGLQQVGELKKQVIDPHTGECRESVRYFATSLTVAQAVPARLLELFRGHWSIENRLHYIQDDSFGEDRHVLHSRQRGRVWALLRRLALNLLRGRLFLWDPDEPMTGRAQAVAAAPLAVLLFLP